MNEHNRPDETLMLQYQKGDLRAFELLYARHKSKVYGYLISNLKDVNKADEVFQNIFMKLHRKKHQYDPKHPFIKWLFVIAKTQMLDYIKSQRSGEQFVEDIHSQSQAPGPERMDFSEIKDLTDREREALSLRYHQESEFAEIARVLGTSSSNARKIISRGVKKLKAALGGE